MEQKRYQAVLFDMDGTLLDSYEANAGTAQLVLEHFGMAPPEGIPMRKFIGPPLDQSYGKWYRWESREKYEEVVALHRALYEERKYLCRVYDGVFPLLERLRSAGIRTALATMKRQAYAELLMERFGLASRLDLVQGRSPDRGIDTKADIVGEALRKLGVTDPRRAALVGDSRMDQEGAREAGVDFIAVYYGYGFSHDPGDEAEWYTAQAETVAELEVLLLSEKIK